MKKKGLIMIITVALAFVMLITLGGCNTLKLNKDYHLYTFEVEKGDFVKNINKITFEKKSYSIYDNTGKLADEGEYTMDSAAITFIPDKIGDAANRMAVAGIKYFYKDYIIDTAPAVANFYAERWTHTDFEDKEGLEGIYTLGGSRVLLNNGGLFVSYDGGNVLDSFTDKVGEYKLNKNKDFVEIEIYDTQKMCLLHFTYQNQYDQTVSALVDTFYSTKAPQITQVQDTMVEFYSQVFVSTSVGGDMANYELSLITFPGKNIITTGVTFETDDTSATISGNKLTYAGTGTVDVSYKYKNYSGGATVSIVKFAIKDALTEEDKTFDEGDELSFNNIFMLFADFDFAGDRVDLSVSFKDTNLVTVESDAMVAGGLVSFDKKGEVTAVLTARYVTYLATNNAPNVVTASKEIKLKIVE